MPGDTLELSQEIELGGKRSARIEAAQRALDVAAADLQDAQARLRGAVRRVLRCAYCSRTAGPRSGCFKACEASSERGQSNV